MPNAEVIGDLLGIALPQQVVAPQEDAPFQSLLPFQRAASQCLMLRRSCTKNKEKDATKRDEF